jgi:hypothetical protein
LPDRLFVMCGLEKSLPGARPPQTPPMDGKSPGEAGFPVLSRKRFYRKEFPFKKKEEARLLLTAPRFSPMLHGFHHRLQRLAFFRQLIFDTHGRFRIYMPANYASRFQLLEPFSQHAVTHAGDHL